MPDRRYVYACRVIEPERRDIAHRYQRDPVELHPAEIGEVRQLAVTLDDEGYEAYRNASNLIEIEPVVEARAMGMPEGEEASADASSAGTRIPTDEDLYFIRSLSMRDRGRRGEGVKVAVLDTALGAGVVSWLRPQIAAARSFVGGNALAGSNDHGSHVATTALPDRAKLVHAAVLDDSGSGRSDGILQGLYWAIEQGADVINMSLGGTGGKDQYERAIAYARRRGVLVFCAAGNEAQRGNPVIYPGACPSAISISAYDRATGSRAPFSTFNEQVDLASSGVNVLAYYASGRLGRMSGTSMATPLAVWAAASAMAESGKRGDAVLQAMRQKAKDTPAPAAFEGSGIVRGTGAKNALKRR